MPLFVQHAYSPIAHTRALAADGAQLVGTDDQARDVFARVLYGARTSIAFALCLALCGAALGVLVGAIQGYYGGWVDLLGQRF